MHRCCRACPLEGTRVRRCACAAGVHTPARPAHSCLQGALLHEQFDAVAADRPDAVCLVDDATGVSLTYREVAEAVDTLAAALAKLGVTRDIGEHRMMQLGCGDAFGLPCLCCALMAAPLVCRCTQRQELVPDCRLVHATPSPLTRGSHVRPASQLWASWWIARPRW